MEKKIGLIIGGNRGIGRALVETLAQHWGEAGLVYLTARNERDALMVQREIREATGLPVATLEFDLADADAPESAKAFLMREHGGIDFVVQNGAYLPRPGYPAVEDARPMVEANSHGTLRVLQTFLPTLREHGQLVIVASALGVLNNLPEHLRTEFDAQVRSSREINAAIDDYVEAVEAGTAVSLGWPEWVNIPSKVAQVALTLAFAREAVELDRLPEGALINAACPGVTLTDATREFMGTVFKESEAQSPKEAAVGLMALLDGPSRGFKPYGKLVQQGKVVPFKGA
jgi:carbonyl reductase 1